MRCGPNWGYEMNEDTRLDGPRAWCHVMYALHALSAASGVLTSATIVSAFLFGWPSIVAVVINFLTRGAAAATWLESHYRWQMRTFWLALLWLLVAGALAITLIGIPAAIVVVLVTGLGAVPRRPRLAGAGGPTAGLNADPPALPAARIFSMVRNLRIEA